MNILILGLPNVGKTSLYNILSNDEYTDVLYLLPSGGSANANRTILDKSKTSIKIIYTDI